VPGVARSEDREIADRFGAARAAYALRGLLEAARVVCPGGQELLYEHVRPRNPVLGKAAGLISPLTRRLFGPELNRRTERSVEAAGLRITEVRRRGI
jgi:hypothetical protein